RFFKRTLEEFFGNSSSPLKSPAFFSSSLLAANWATIFSLLRCLAFTDVFAILVVVYFQLLFNVSEGHTQLFQQFVSLFICIGSSYECDVKTSDPVHFIDIHFREYDLLSYTH